MTNEQTKPLIQIDDLVRPMTDEEYEAWLAQPKTKPLGNETRD